MFNNTKVSMKKLSVALAISALFATGAAHATTSDLTTWSQNIGISGSVSTSANFANLIASSSITSLVTGATSFQWFFQAHDYMPYNDWAYVSLNGVQTTLSDVATVGNYGNSGWQTYLFGSAFTGQLGFGVNNAQDNAFSSQLYIQNVNVAAVPEPETYAMLLAGLGLLGFMVRRKDLAA
jgi:PEP-CTERM motif